VRGSGVLLRECGGGRLFHVALSLLASREPHRWVTFAGLSWQGWRQPGARSLDAGAGQREDELTAAGRHDERRHPGALSRDRACTAKSGVRPQGARAQVRRSTGSIMKPVSWRQIKWARRRASFFTRGHSC
jgi:hypothetical protein